MGGTTEPIANALKDSYPENADLADALRIAGAALEALLPKPEASGSAYSKSSK